MLEIDPKKRPLVRTVFSSVKNWDKIEKGDGKLIEPPSTGSD